MSIVTNGFAYSLVDGELVIMDVTNPRQPIQVGYLGGQESLSYSDSIALKNGFIYAGQGQDLVVVAVSDVTQPQEVSRTELSNDICSIAIGEEYVYLVTQYQCSDDDMNANTLQVISIADPTNLSFIGLLPLQGDIQIRAIEPVTSVAVEGQYAYVTAGDLWLVDISNPAGPRQVAFMETPGDAREVVVDGELVYVADGDGGLLVLRRRP